MSIIRSPEPVGRMLQEAARFGRLTRPAVRGTRVGLTFSRTVSPSITHLPDVAPPGQVVHGVQQDLFEDGPQPAGARSPA